MRRWPVALLSGLMLAAGVWVALPASAETASFDPASCVAVSDQGLSTGAHLGSLAAAGQTDCLELPTPSGAKLEIWMPAYSSLEQDLDIDVVDADGTVICHQWCELSGPAPYRVLVNALDAVAAYQLTVQRTDEITGCGSLALGATAAPSFSAERFATCYAIPADAHATSEIVAAAPAARTAGNLWTAVYDGTGEGICGGYLASFQVEIAKCRLRAGEAYSLAVVGRPTSTEYRVGRRDSSPAGADCDTPVSTAAGGPATAGSITAADDIKCYRLSGAAAESFWANVRDSGAVKHAVFDAAGNEVPCSEVQPCRLTGSSGYQIFVWSSTITVPQSYLLDTWFLGAPGRTPAECPTAADPTRLAPVSGTLDAERTGVCYALPVRTRTEFQVRITGGTELPGAYLFDLGGTSAQTAGWCRWSDAFQQHCALTLPASSQPGTAILALSPGWRLGSFPFRAEFDCVPGPCEPLPVPVTLTSVTPAAVPNSGPVSLTLAGGPFTAANSVLLTRAGVTVAASVTGVSADGTVLTAQADVTGVAAGAWDVTVAGSVPAVLTVTAAPLTLTRAPSITGTARVGYSVRALTGTWSPSTSSHTYQWTANGVAIPGAVGSSYTIPAGLRGKRLAVIVTAKLANRLDTVAVSGSLTVGYGVAPRSTVKPKIIGTAKAGRTVKVSVGAWSPKATAFGYAWRVNGKVVSSASKIKLKKSWVGKKLTVVVVAKKAGYYDGRATSSAAKIRR
ncbi:hypothetical protein AB0M02_42290 [Actinoplanes sp. NPDC051861]|uniref:hypothetical protein n=1 Tax=Actinoplanes sp. NPDC051861 TaxID=3155170 RepID=UPI003432AA16